MTAPKRRSLRSSACATRAVLVFVPWILVCFVAPGAMAGGTVLAQEMAARDEWVKRNLLTAGNNPPFSFYYHGLPSSDLLPSWVRVQTDTVLDANRTQHVITWTNAGFPLQVKCVAVEYTDFPAVEWTAYLKNVWSVNTPIVKDVLGLDTTFSRTDGAEFVLNGLRGDSMTADSYEPFRVTLLPNTVWNFAPPGNGKSSEGPNGWPYYNLQMSGGGLIMAIGWPGQWASSFTRDSANSLRLKAGQELISLYLKPGEQIRTPLIAMLFWQGTDLVRAQNLWRRYYRAHVMPPESLPVLAVGGDTFSVINAYLQAGIVPDVLWQDAGWYPISQGPYSGGESWLNTGTWMPDPARYPSGFKPVSDQLHANRMKFLLWFEPERVGSITNSWLGTNHSDWLLQPGSAGYILNEGNPEAFGWLTNHFDRLIKTNGVDWYREDMNGGGPCPSWRANDTSTRQGITENLYVQNHLAYWDALRAMNPGLRIDSCASGGRRNDLETMRRAVPLLRSDFQYPSMAGVVEGNQCHTYGLSYWLPFQGSGSYFTDVYSFRTFYLPSFIMAFGLTPANYAAQQQAYRECKLIAPCMLFGDYYPLTPYSLEDNVWMAWQFDRPEGGDGCVQIFRRTNSPVSSMQFRLQALDPAATYVVRDFDRGGLGWYTADELMNTGLTVALNLRGAAVIYYARATTQISVQSGTNWVLKWPGTSGKLYSITSSTNPALREAWSIVASNLLGNGAMNCWTGRINSGTSFLRVVQQ